MTEKTAQKVNIAEAIKEYVKRDREFALFLAVGVFVGISQGINFTVFNNYLNDIHNLSASLRGIVEFPRELPGMLVMLVLGVLSFLGDIRMSVIGMICAALGFMGLGLFSPTFSVMLVWLMTYSLGTHVFMPLSASIGMSLSQKEDYGRRLGRYNAYNLAATIAGYAIVWLGFKYLSFTYKTAFIIGAVCYIIAAGFLLAMKADKPKEKKIKLVLRKKYTLYYILNVINGARKQIFLTFAPWVLIQVYHLDPPTFAILGVMVSLLSIVTRTVIGDAIDKKGERFVLSLGAMLIIVICIGYSAAGDLFSAGIAVIVLSACYIIDNSMNVVEMARSTYVKKIALYPEDVTPTLSAGVSFDHIIAMTIPFFGGVIWTAFGYKYVFMLAAVIAVVNLYFTMKIKVE
ncbi:major facilitator superfamily protein [Oxobacter pfennigii]|uniref:Major facilitator superfamily protein n=1 Tax=Oxobacter pfennigii TaxID=36849 RepID=A0A0P8YYA6_9CLOT|nr:MFS transporter [Oxobacter pfennigii]KPU44746.1 major facilitator superfamily protein [Oxobacter pfennigii]